MRKLHTKVNLIPVIAKADTLTDEEVTTFKERVCPLSSPDAELWTAGLLRNGEGSEELGTWGALVLPTSGLVKPSLSRCAAQRAAGIGIDVISVQRPETPQRQ